ncbi:uncharacterized protein RAG0_08885 [Rhynchosporium agropyri]|uniref:Uncharacterized protein n=1 Tax=Rhynchosporium agropyri TaxID=914238 RepID=A0A1E1KSV8_9HELO|nr:uncharacterized protein RAG0_08885 [Rhynchosporium agropyri]
MANQAIKKNMPAMVTVTDQGPPSPRRSTISAYPSPSSQRKNGDNGQCTHLTTTRLYTTDFRCAFCFRLGSFGWVYRCTQDRELLLDEDIQHGLVEKLDKFCESLPKSTFPHKRSAAARTDKLSFLDEISDEAMRSYTPEQLKIILAQRADVLDQAAQPEYPNFPESFYQDRPLPTPHPHPPPSLPGLFLSPTNDNGLKPWFPLQGGECQFKCCHVCRPSLRERSYLSLNGIADGDIPSTSIMGFGFHLTGQRPVGLVKHVQNLGLRPNPPPAPNTQQENTQEHHSNPSSPNTSASKKRTMRPALSIGLGILAQETVHPSVSPDYTKSSTPLIPPTPTFSALPSTTTLLGAGMPGTTLHPTTPILGSFEQQALASLPDSGKTNRRHSYSPTPSPSIGLGSVFTSLANVTPRQQSAASGQFPNGDTLTTIPLTANIAASTRPKSETEEATTAEHTSGSTPETIGQKDVKTSTNYHTAMETNELIQSQFGSAPLEVKDGIAVTEKSVSLHVADFITQF